MDSEFWKDTKFEEPIPSLEFYAGKSLSCWGLHGTILGDIIHMEKYTVGAVGVDKNSKLSTRAS